MFTHIVYIIDMKTGTTTTAARWRVLAAVGAALWLIWAIAVRPEWTAVLLLLSPFVILPLGLRLASVAACGPEAPILEKLAAFAPAVAITAALSFIPDVGLAAATISLPWLVFTSAVALVGLRRLLSRASLLDPGVAVDAGLMFLVVGGSWLTISRAGLNPLGFSDAIVQLTAVHFHYAGFALPIVTGFVAKQLSRGPAVPLAIMAGVPLTAIGITAGGDLEWVAATFMAIAGLATAFAMLRLGMQSRGLARALTLLAGASLTGGMALALGWAWTIKFETDYLGLEGMAATHGSLNALGFGLVGLIGLNLIARVDEKPDTSVALFTGRPSEHHLIDLARRAATHETTNEPGLLNRPVPDGFRHKVWHTPVEHDDFERAKRAIQQWAGHHAAGIVRWPERPPITVGETLAIAIPVGPLSVSATSRIVDVVDEPNRYGFTYSTLPHHPADGEESFIVERHDDGTLDITVTAVWKPATLANKVCPPLSDYLQGRAIGMYLDGIAGGGLSHDEAMAAS